MTNQLPAHLQKRASRTLIERAVQGLGSSLPPRISIQGNGFTLIDAQNAEQFEGNVIDICIADISDVICKEYRNHGWDPDNPEPPTCWSANGVAPSINAAQPQSSTCASCPKNVRGSATSKISGAAIKACRDEKWLAVLPVKYPNMLFQLKVTPGSFDNWKTFTKPFEGGDTDVSDVVVRIAFTPKTNGVLTFQATAYIDATLAQAREIALQTKATDILVGRDDRPRGLPAPAATQAIEHQQPAGFQPAPFGAPNVANQPSPTGPVQTSIATSPSDAAPTGRRRRRTQAEMQAAQQTPAPVAPFRQEPAGQAPLPFGQPAAAPGPAFGVGPGVAPNPDLAAALQNAFGGPK